MSETWQVFRLEELAAISFECPSCQTQITFGAEADIISGQERMCPGCNKAILEVGALLSMYRQLYQRGKTKIILKAKA
jgi:hypothetical protein